MAAGWAKCGLWMPAAWGTHLLTVRSLVWFLGDSASSSVMWGWQYIPADTFRGLTHSTRGVLGFVLDFCVTTCLSWNRKYLETYSLQSYLSP